MINFDYIIKEDIKKHNPNWPNITYHPYRILIVGGTGYGETGTDKIYLYTKDPYEEKFIF